MCVPARIPLPVTILYVVTVTNLVILLNLTLVDANVRVLNRFNQTVVDSIMDLPAKFGDAIPNEGIWGHLIYADPRDACSPILPPPKATSNESGIANKWIALVQRSNCNFDWKVIQAQKQGYVAVIIHNVGSDKLVPMKGTGNASKVHIPSIFIGFRDAEYLYEKCNDDIHCTIVIDNISPIIDPNTAKLIFSVFGIVIGSCFLTMIVFAVVKWIRDYRRRSRSRLSKANLKQLPIQKFKKGDVYDICAICLDEYEEGEKLRILPCNHAYHMKCIDPWLLKNKKTCPICKRKVMPSRNHSDSESDSDESDDETASESAPLLSGGNRYNGTHGNTFNNTGVPERLLQHYNFNSSDEEDDDDGDETGDSVRGAGSHLQSSVEVHSEPDYRSRRAMRPPRRIGGLTARYAMFADNNSDEQPTTSTNQEQLENGAAQQSSSRKPETKPKNQRAWEYGLSPPKLDHFSIYNETQERAEEEGPVAIEMSPNGSQEEDVNGTSERKKKDTDDVKASNRVKKSRKSGEKLSESSQEDVNENRLEAAGTGSTGSKTRKPKSPDQVSSKKSKGKRASPTVGVVNPMNEESSRNDQGNPTTSENAKFEEVLPKLPDGDELNIQAERRLELEGAVGGIEADRLMEQPIAVGGMEEENLLEQPIVEVVTTGRRKTKRKLTKKKR